MAFVVFLSIAGFFGIFSEKAFAGIGVSPAAVDNSHIKPGQTIEQVVNVSRAETGAATDIFLELDVPDEIEDWFSFEPGTEFTIGADETSADFTIVIKVPEDAEVKNYTGYVRIKTTTGGEGTVSVIQGVRFDLNLGLSNEDYVELILRNMVIADVYQGEPLPLTLTIENKGNTEAGPTKAAIKVKDLSQNDIITLETTDLETIDPNSTEDIVALFDQELEPGQYYAETTVTYNDTVLREDILTFTVRTDNRPKPAETTEENKDYTLYYVLGGVLLVLSAGAVFLWFLISKRKNKEEETVNENGMNRAIGDINGKESESTRSVISDSNPEDNNVTDDGFKEEFNTINSKLDKIISTLETIVRTKFTTGREVIEKKPKKPAKRKTSTRKKTDDKMKELVNN